MRYWLLAQIMLGSMGLCLVWPDTQGLGPLWPIRGEYCVHWPITAHLVDVLDEHVVQPLQALLVVILVEAGEYNLKIFDGCWYCQKYLTANPKKVIETVFLVYSWRKNLWDPRFRQFLIPGCLNFKKSLCPLARAGPEDSKTPPRCKVWMILGQVMAI